MTETCIVALISGVVSVISIIAGVIIACVSKPKDLEAEEKFNKYRPKLTIDSWDYTTVCDIVDKGYIGWYCKTTRRYIIKRYKKIKKEKKNNEQQN